MHFSRLSLGNYNALLLLMFQIGLHLKSFLIPTDYMVEKLLLMRLQETWLRPFGILFHMVI